jgi:hypothetical protein
VGGSGESGKSDSSRPGPSSSKILEGSGGMPLVGQDLGEIRIQNKTAATLRYVADPLR